MERSEKIFLILALAALIGVLVAEHGNAQTSAIADIVKIPADRLGVSKTPDTAIHHGGPAYLLSNLPKVRRRDDYAQPVSVGVWDFAAE